MADTKSKNKVALVTGSTKGIGKAIADKFEGDGITVIRNGRSDNSYKHYIKADVGKREDVKKIKKFIEDNFERLDILVNNAAFTTFIEHKDLHKLTDDIFDEIYNVNLKGPFMCIQELDGLLTKSDETSIINIASVAGITGQGSNIAYGAMKSALINMTKSMARCLAPIRVNSISPGLIETDLVTFPEGYIPMTLSKTPLKRIGQPVDIGDVALYLVKMKYVSGENIIVDGGRFLN